MAALVLLRNPLAPQTRELHPLAEGARVIDWLQTEYPTGFGMPVRFYVNGEEKPLDDLDYAVTEDDVAVIALMPAEPISLTAIAVNLLIAAALSAASYFAQQIFAPKQEAGQKRGDQVSVFDVSTDQNAARIGDPIPVLYGNVLMSPDYVSQPYVFYDWNQANFDQLYNGVQYLNMLLCVGQGNIDVTDVFLGDTDATTIEAGVVGWRAFKPAEHRSSLGVIAGAMGFGFHENVVTSPEVSNQEFLNAGDAAGYFATAKPGVIGNAFQIDVVFPTGCYDPEGDQIEARTTYFNVYFQELDDNDNRIGTEYVTTVTASTKRNTSVTGPYGANVTVGPGATRNMTAIISPIRRSYMFYPPKAARWAVRLVRTSGAPNAKNGADRWVWTGLKLYANYPAGTAYGNVTLLAVRVKASQGLGNDASTRVRVRAIRRLTPPTGGTEAQSTSGADAFADAYVNTVYGAARPRSELDTATLTSLRSKWNGYSFNYVFRDRSTVFEALRTITTPFFAEPLPLGSIMSVAQDGRKNIRSALFTDANIVAGSLKVGYSFDEEGAADGVEIEYLDPRDFRQSYAKVPSRSDRPDRFVLPGVTNATHALEYATVAYRRTQQQRKRVTFDTELEGLLLQMGDRIGVAHNVPKWGDSGLVLAVDGRTLIVDHDLDWTGGAKQILLRKPDGSVTDAITVTQGAAANMILLPSAAPTTINVDNDYDYTSFAFGASTTLVRDFIVTAVTPTGENTVTVEAVNYNPDVYLGGMFFLLV